MKINWKEQSGKYQSGEWGYKGRIKLFWIGWNVTLKEHNENPYILTHYLPSMTNNYRFENIETGKKFAETLLDLFIEEINKGE